MNDLRTHLKTLLALVSLIGILAVSCGLLESDATVFPPSFDEATGIMKKSCAACHQAATLDGLITSVRELNTQPMRFDSTSTYYTKRLVMDEIAALASKMNLIPQLDFRDSLSLNDYTNNLAGKRDVLCQRLQFRNFRPYFPQGMPPPYADALRLALSDPAAPYLSGWADPASVLGSFQSADSIEPNLFLTLLPGGELSQTHYTTGARYRNDSVFVNDTQLVALFSLSNGALFWDDRLFGKVYRFVKISPLQALADFVSKDNLGYRTNSSRWRELGIFTLTQAQCVYCHSRDNFLSSESKYQISEAPLLQRISRLAQQGFWVNIKYNPLGIARQFKSLGHTLVLIPSVDFSDSKAIERFLSLPNEAQDMADRLQTPLYQDWYPGGMPPPWAKTIFQAVDPGAKVYGFVPLLAESRKVLLDFLKARLNVGDFTFQGLSPDEYSCCNDVGTTFGSVSGYLAPLPCSLTPYFPDEAADSLASH